MDWELGTCHWQRGHWQVYLCDLSRGKRMGRRESASGNELEGPEPGPEGWT